MRYRIINAGLRHNTFLFLFFSTIPDEDDRVLIKGILLRKGKNDDEKYIYLIEYNNRFTESYLSRKKFDDIEYTIDSVFIHIRKIDTVRLNRNKKIKLWSLRLNKETLYTSKQEIEKQSFAHMYFIPLLALACFILAPVLYKYQKNYYQNRSTENFS